MTKRYLALAGACLAMMAAPAQAAIYALTWTGTVVGTDADGWFGERGTVLDGQSFDMSFNIDPETATFQETAGRVPYKRYEKIRSNTLTIGGRTVSQSNGFVDRTMWTLPNGFVTGQQIYSLAEGQRLPDEPMFMLAIRRSGSSLFASIDPLSAFAYTPRAGDEATGTFRGKATTLTFRPGSATFARVADAALPEPASWTMMIGGFALVGAAARRRAHSGVRTVTA